MDIHDLGEPGQPDGNPVQASAVAMNIVDHLLALFTGGPEHDDALQSYLEDLDTHQLHVLLMAAISLLSLREAQLARIPQDVA